ncbi:MAG TPA: ABC transporter permease [Candidatus Kapabacteria bacterium]|nr:ABC transporter permease [Candidatus Kapabacteria bacterium]
MKKDKKSSICELKLERTENSLHCYFSGDFVFSNSKIINSYNLKKNLKDINKLIIDFADLDRYDSFLVSWLNVISSYCKNKNIEFQILNMSEEAWTFYDFLKFQKEKFPKLKETKSLIINFFEYLGNTFKKLISDGINFLNFFGDTIVSFSKILWSPGSIRWEDFPRHFISIGINAVPISVLILFLIGLITGYQGALLLRNFGADIYIADAVGIALTRELSPLMVAIIVAGRSGSAFTAEIGSMKVSEEVDALKIMGFNIQDFLVMPRMISMIISLPIVVIFADIIGVLGGLVASIGTLDITMTGYLNRLQVAVDFNDILSGLIKAVIFGFVITLIGCFRGMQVSGGAESVGKYTTSSVVTSIFHIILIDAVFTILFPILGI